MALIIKNLFFIFVILSSVKASGKDVRIIGGFQANIRLYPFMAAITIDTENGRYFCGGTHWGDQWVITAAQCVVNATSIQINLGSASLNGQDPNRVELSTGTYFIHPDFDPINLNNDIAIVKFHMPIVHTEFVNSVGSLPSEDVELGVQAYALGWGQTSDDSSSLSSTLRVAHLVPISNEECRTTYGNQITDNMICLAGNYNEGICHGDTGGPFVTTSRTGVSTLEGIASFLSASGCETVDPSGFTRVYPYVAWLNDIVNNK